MPIEDLHEDRDVRVKALLLGHIRLGVFKGGRPQESDTLIFTSADQSRLEPLAHDFGGSIETYQPQGAGTEPYRVVSESTALTAVFPFADLAANVAQDWTLWGRAGLKRTCTGYQATLNHVDEETGEITHEDVACICAAKEKRECQAETRVRLILAQTGLGIWELLTHSKIAATELWDQARFMAEVSGGRMNRLPVRVVWARREISYFDEKEKRRRTTTKRIVSLSIAGDAERALRPLGVPPDHALIEAVRQALADAGRELVGVAAAPALPSGNDHSPPSEPATAAAGAGKASEPGVIGDTGSVSHPESPPGPERPSVDPEITSGPYKGRRLSEVIEVDRAYVEGMLAEARAKARREAIQAWLDWASPRLVS